MVNDRKYCGRSTNTDILISNSFKAVIHFRTDEDISAGGFELKWHWVKQWEVFQVDSDDDEFVTMHSVNYPDAFPDEVKNCSTVFVPNDMRLLVTINDINLPGESCQDSIFKVYSNSSIIRTFCGGTTMDGLKHFSQYIVTDNGNVTFCLEAPQIRKGEGIHMETRKG